MNTCNTCNGILIFPEYLINVYIAFLLPISQLQMFKQIYVIVNTGYIVIQTII